MTTHRLLVDCADEPGLIHRITGVVFRSGFNITRNDEYVDPAARRFFMRTAFTGPAPVDGLADELQSELPPGANVRITAHGDRPVVVLATRESHCLGDLLLRHHAGELPARIVAVVSNYESLRGLVAGFGVPYHHVPHDGCSRAAHEAAVLAAIAPYAPEYLVLAKYMRVLTTEFVARFAGRILNIHHSFLPAFVGARPYHQAFERGVKIIGATAHVVTDDLDTGPIIAQGVLPVTHAHTAADMVQAGRDVEKTVLARALRLVLEDRVFLHGNRAIVFE